MVLCQRVITLTVGHAVVQTEVMRVHDGILSNAVASSGEGIKQKVRGRNSHRSDGILVRNEQTDG